MTAAQAILKECRTCNGGPQSTCISRICNLHPDVWEGKHSKVRQIRAHCLECAGSVPQVKTCSGKLLFHGDNGNICYLHPFRFGKNPARPKSASHPPVGFQKKHGPQGLYDARIDDLPKKRITGL